MKLLSFIGALCVLLAPCAFDHVNARRSLQPCGDSEVHKARISLPQLLPRNLEPKQDDVKRFADHPDVGSPNRKLLMQAPPGNKQEEKVKLHQQQTGTWREWIESPNKSDFFTMDYRWVKRRRPIHNKNFPFLP